MRQDTGVPRSRPEYHPVRGADGRQGFRTGRRVVRKQAHRLHLADGRRHLHLALHARELVGATRVDTPYVGDDVERYRGHRQDPTLGTEEPPDPVKPLDVATEQLPQCHDEEVPDRMVMQITVTGKAMLKDLRPGAPPLVVSAQC